MSDQVKDIQKGLARAADTAKKKDEINTMRINTEYEKMKEIEKNLELLKKSTFGALSPTSVESLVKENTEYIESASAPMKFISEAFENVVPFFRKNMILIGAKTGGGKSTAVANIVRSTLPQINPDTGLPRKVMVLTNEENATDFYNRVTCLIEGWNYVNHDKFTREQKEKFAQMIPALAKDGRLTVISDAHEVEPGVMSYGNTTTVEGIENIFETMMREKTFYDVVILDYYQGITESAKDARLNEYESQASLTHVLEKYRKIYPGVIVIMAQINPPTKEENTPFQVRLQGRKLVCTKATMILEMLQDSPNLRTEWVIHKGRFSESIGQSVMTGFDRGQFVKYDEEFVKKVSRIKEDRERKKLFKGIDKKEEKK